MERFIGILVAVFAIMVMIIVHEYGHFLAARIFKVPVYEFSVGMGPLIKQKFSKKGTKFSLRAIPIGGYCAFDDSKSASFVDAALEKIPVWQKIIICFAGPLINILFGVFIFFCAIFFIGARVDSGVVSSVREGFPSINILQENDKIIAINDIELNRKFDVSDAVAEFAPSTLKVTVSRNGEELDFNITPKLDNGKYYIGVTTLLAYEKLSFPETIEETFTIGIDSIKTMWKNIAGIFTRQVNLGEVSGIVGVVAFMSEFATSQKLFMFLQIAALVSINLGIMNLLPIPGLDGSKILFGIIEIIRGKKMKPEFELRLIQTGFVFLIALVIVTLFNDVFKIFF